MKHLHPMHLLVVAALVALVALAGCPQQPTEEPGPAEPMVDDPGAVTPDESGEPAAVDVPASAETLADAMAAFQMPTSFEMTMTEGGDEDTPQSMLMKMDGTTPVAMKAESDEGIMLIDWAGGAMYMYDPEDNTALKMAMDEDQASDLPIRFDFSEAKDAKVIGSETIDGVDCWIVEAMDEDEVGKTWIGKADGLVRQVEEEDGEMIRVSYSRINEVPDSEFELPEDAKIEDMDAMFEGTGDMPDMPEEGGE